MAQVNLKILANEGATSNLSLSLNSGSINNVSSPINTVTTKNNGVIGKTLSSGSLSLSDGFLGGENTKIQSEVNKYNGYMFGIPLPQGYEQLEYIQSTGTQYINTGFKPNGKRVKMIIDAQVVSITNNLAIIGGCSDFVRGFYISMYPDNQGFHQQYSTSYGYCGNQDYQRHKLILEQNDFVIDNTHFNRATWDVNNDSNDLPNYNIFLFNGSWRGVRPQNTSSIKIYSAQIWADDVLVRDFVPCRETQGLTAGLYDRVTKTFFTNAGRGDFEEGDPSGIELTISGTNISKIEIIGDKEANQYPIEAILDEGELGWKRVFSDDNYWGILFNKAANTHKIRFVHWNRSDYNACITTIKVFVEYLELNKGWIDDLEDKTQITTDASSINYESLSNSANVNIRDLNGELLDYIKDNIIDFDKTEIQLYVNGKKTDFLIANGSNYIEEDKTLNISLSSPISNLDKLTYKGRNLSSEMNAYALLKEIMLSINGGIDGDRYFTLTNDVIQINGNASYPETTLTSSGTIQYKRGHKYYVSYDVKASQNGYSSEFFFPVIAGNSFNSNAETEWKTVSGFIQNTSTNDSMQYFRIDNNNNNSNVTMYFKNIFILDLTELGINSQNLSWCNRYIYNSSKVDKMCSNSCYDLSEMSTTIKSYLKSITIPYPYLGSESYRSILEKFCQLAQLCLTSDENGDLIFISNRPLIDTIARYTAIKIPKAYMITNPNKSIIIKNKYKAVNTKVTKVVDKVDIKSLLTSWINTEHTGEYSTETREASGENTSLTITSRTWIRLTYLMTTIRIDKSMNNNLTQIQSILTGLDNNGNTNIRYNVSGKYYTGTVSRFAPYPITWGNPSEWSGTIATYQNQSFTFGTATATLSDLSNLNSVTFTDNGDYYSANIKVAIGKQCWGVMDDAGGSSTAFKYEPEKVEISFYGNKREISFEEIDASTQNSSPTVNTVTIESNELIQENTRFDDESSTKVINKIKNNILDDYENGISDATIEIMCGNMYSEYGNLVKNWGNGEMIDKGDYIYFEGDINLAQEQRYWKVTGRNLIQNGYPRLQLELQECKNI